MPGPMIIPGAEVTIATALAQSRSLPSQSNPVQIRYDHHREELNPLGLYIRETDKLTVTD